METQILETWEINNRVNLYVLDSVAPEFLIDISASKGEASANNSRIFTTRA